MSTATSFKYHKAFPVTGCVLELATGSNRSCRALSLADAMKWVWNLESLRVQATGDVNYTRSGAAWRETFNFDLTLSKDHATDTVYLPHERVCPVIYLNSTGHLQQADAWTVERFTEPGAGSDLGTASLAGTIYAQFGAFSTLRYDPTLENYFFTWGIVVTPNMLVMPGFLRFYFGGTPFFEVATLGTSVVAGATIEPKIGAGGALTDVVVNDFTCTITPSFYTY